MGTVIFNTDVDKTVDITKNVTLDVDKDVFSFVDLDGSLATAEASADALGGPGNGNGNGDGNGLVQLYFLIDGSGSISDAEFQLQLDGLRQAIGNTTADFELTIIQFGIGGAQVEIGPVMITDANRAMVASQIDTSANGGVIDQLGGGTPINAAIDLAVATLTADPNFDPDNTQLINLASDGNPNNLGAAQAAAAAAQAVFDGLSAEGIGDGVNLANLDTLTFPDGVIIDPFNAGDPLPEPTQTAFTLGIDDFAEFGDAVEAKLAEIFDDDDAAGVLAEVDTFAQVSEQGAFAFAESLSALDMG